MSQLHEMFAESGLDPDAGLLDVLGPLGELAAAPEPSARLSAAFLGVDVLVAHVSRSARLARTAAGAAMAAVVGVTGTGLAAAANTLPAPLQHRVSDFSERFLPFRFPEPTHDVVSEPKPGEVEREGAVDAPTATQHGTRPVPATPARTPGGQSGSAATGGRTSTGGPTSTGRPTSTSSGPSAGSATGQQGLSADPSAGHPRPRQDDDVTGDDSGETQQSGSPAAEEPVLVTGVPTSAALVKRPSGAGGPTADDRVKGADSKGYATGAGQGKSATGKGKDGAGSETGGSSSSPATGDAQDGAGDVLLDLGGPVLPALPAGRSETGSGDRAGTGTVPTVPALPDASGSEDSTSGLGALD